jgi:WD40 repeat protein
VIVRALAKAPGERFATADAFIRALRDCGTGAASLPKGGSSRRRVRVGIGVAIVASAIATAFLIVRGEPRPVVSQRQFTFTGTASSPVFSPDGKAVLYTTAYRDLMVQPLGGEPRSVVPRARFLMSPRWSGDGSAILFWMYRDSTDLPGTWMVPSRGGPPRLVVRDMAPFDAGPDSTTILIAPRDRHRLEIVDIRTGLTRRTMALPDPVPEVKDLAWEADRRLIGFQTLDGRVWALPGSGGVPQRLATAITTFASHTIAWSPAGGVLYYLSGDEGAIALMRLEVDRTTGRALTPPQVVLNQHDSDALDVGPRGKIVLTQTFRSSQVYAIEYDESRPARIRSTRALSTGTSVVSGGNVSPDGRLVAFARTAGEFHDIEVAPFDGGASQVLVRSKDRVWPAAWSPDGQRLGYWEQDSSGSRLMQFDIRQQTSRRLTSVARGGGWVDWAAGGSRLLFPAMRGHGFGVLELAGQRQSLVRLPDSLGTTFYRSAISPDGMQVVLSTLLRNADWAALWVVSADGRGWRRAPEPFGESGAIAWHPDGWVYLVNSRAVYNDRGVPGLELWRTRLPEGPLDFVAPLPDGCTETVTLSANARHAACLRASDASDLVLVEGLDDRS